MGRSAQYKVETREPESRVNHAPGGQPFRSVASVGDDRARFRIRNRNEGNIHQKEDETSAVVERVASMADMSVSRGTGDPIVVDKGRGAAKGSGWKEIVEAQRHESERAVVHRSQSEIQATGRQAG